MNKIYIFRSGYIHIATSIEKHESLDCYYAEIHQHGFGPKTKRELVPAHNIFSNFDELADAVDDHIHHLKKRLEKLASSIEEPTP